MRWTVSIALCLAAPLCACGPSAPGVIVATPIPDEAFAPAGWETSWEPEEFDTWKDGLVIEPPQGPHLLESTTPIGGVRVELLVPAPDGRSVEAGRSPPAVTGPDGRFRLGPAPAAGWIVRATKEGFADAYVGDGAGDALHNVVAPPVAALARVGLRPAIEARLRVVDEAKRPLGGVHLLTTAPAYREELTTAADGSAVVRAPRGPVIVEVEDAAREAAPVTVFAGAETAATSTEIVARPREPVRGSVSAPDGRRIANAVVLSLENPSVRTRTGPDGRFELLLRRREHIAAFADGWGWRSLTLPRAGEVDLRVHPVPGLDGIVVDAQGRPVAGARVVSVVRGFNSGFERAWGPRTAADGTFRFSWMPRPPRDTPPRPCLLAFRRGMGESEIVVPGESGAAANAPVRLTLGGVRDVEGTVRRASGEPAAGIAVFAKWGHFDVVSPAEAAVLGLPVEQVLVTDAQGRYRFRGVPRGLHAKVRCVAENVTIERNLEGPAAVAGPVDIDLPPGKPLGGRVVAADGKPPEGEVTVTVQLLDTEGVEAEHSRKADPDGAFRFDDLPEGRYQIRAEGAAYDLAGGKLAMAGTTDVTVRIERSATVKVRFAFEGGAVPALPLLFTMLPVPGGSQQFRKVLEAGRAGEGIDIGGVYPGDWKLALEGDVWRGAIDRLEVGDGARLDVEMKVVRTIRLMAHLVDAAGAPVANQLVVVAPVAPAAGRPQSSVSGPDGALDLTGLAPGRWSAEVTPEQRAPLHQEFTVAEGTNAPIELRLPAFGTLDVRVLAQDRPVPGAIVVLSSGGVPVNAWGAGAPNATSKFRADDEGHAVIRGVRAGPVTIEVHSGPAKLAAQDADVTPGATTEVEVKSP